MSEKQRLAFVRAGLVLLPLISLLGCGGAEGQPFGGGGSLGRGGCSPGTGGIIGNGGATPGGGATGSGSGGAGFGGKTGTGGVVATGGTAVGGSSTGGAGGGGVGGKAAGGSGVGGKAAGGSGAGGKATGGTSAGGAGGKASGGAPGTGGVPVGGNGGHAAGGAGGSGGSAGTGGSGPDCATMASQYDAELQKNARNCTTNTVGACAVKVPQNLTCMSSCITFVEDTSGRLQKIYASWQDAGCAKRLMICPTLIACVNPKGATCVASLTTGTTTGASAASAPIVGLPGTCQDDTGATTQ